MTDWDDVRYFLAVARAPTVRAAAEKLGVNHSTVLRRIAQLEARLQARLFERLPSGYRLSPAGAEVLDLAGEMELVAGRFEARIVGRDQAVAGSLRVSLPPTLASHLLAPVFVDFARLHPEVELEVLATNNIVNLTNREADVAIRVVYNQASLPPNLHGIKGPALFGAVYIARDLLARMVSRDAPPARWIVRSDHGRPTWATVDAIPVAGIPYRTDDSDSQIGAVRQGLGITALSCFIGDADPALARVPGSPAHRHGTIWILTQGETRKTRRVRLLVDAIGRTLAANAALIGGEAPAPDRPAGDASRA